MTFDGLPRVPGAPPAVRGRRDQCGNTGRESTVPPATSGGGEAGLRAVGADADRGRA
jgi:hypothetical protein